MLILASLLPAQMDTATDFCGLHHRQGTMSTAATSARRQASPTISDTTVPHIYIHISWTSITSLFVTKKKPEPMKSLWWKLTSDKRNLLPSARMSHLSFFPSVQRFQVHDQSNSCSIEAILFCCMVCIHKETEALATVIKLRYFNKRAPDVWTEDQWLQNLFRNLFILPYS